MRLFLHGKSTTSVLMDQLHQLRTAADTTDPVTIVWFSQWTFGSMNHWEVEHQLMDLLLMGRLFLDKVIVQNCHVDERMEHNNSVSGEQDSSSSLCSSSSQNLWSTLLHHTKSLTIRYDVQQDHLFLPEYHCHDHDHDQQRHDDDDDNDDQPLVSTNQEVLHHRPQDDWIHNDSNHHDDNTNHTTNNRDYFPLEDVEVEGVTLTLQSLEALEELCSQAAPRLKRLSMKSHWTTLEVDHQHSSILGRRESDVEPHLTRFCQFLLQSCMSHLTVLELVHCHLVDSCLAEILKDVLVSSSDSDSTPPTTNTGTRMQLQSLNLRGNMAKEKTLKVIAQCLLHPNCALSHLDLGEQRQYYSTNLHPSPPVTVDRFSVRMMEHLVEGIEGNRSLKSLSLAKNQFCSTTSLPNLLQALRRRDNHHNHHNNALQHLDLQDCGLSSRDVQCLAQALSQQLRLRRLDLSGQQRLSGHKIKHALVGPLLSSNPYLCKIHLPQNIESKTLEWILEWNRIGRRAVLHVGPDGDGHSTPTTATTASVPPNLWPTLLERANLMCQHYATEEMSTRHSASAIYYLLRQGGCDILSRFTDSSVDIGLASRRPTRIGCCSQDTLQELSKVQSRTSPPPIPPTPSTSVSPETIRQQMDNSEEIELSFVVLEETSSFEKPTTMTATRNKTRNHTLKVLVDIPETDGALERPRLSSTRRSPLFKNYVPGVRPRVAWGAE